MAARADKDLSSVPEADRLEPCPHPRNTARLIGHASAEADLLRAYQGGTLHHAWLLTGPRGIGKATLAWRFARFLLTHPDPAMPAVREARDLCVPAGSPASSQLSALAHPDLALVRRQWNRDRNAFGSGIAADEMRAATQLFHGTAAYDGWRIAIIDAADDLTESSGNALLKMLEEPPRKALFLVVAHNVADVLVTIRSRCRRLHLAPLQDEQVADVTLGMADCLATADPAVHRSAAARARGSVARAIALLDPETMALREAIEAMFDGLPSSRAANVQSLADRLAGRAGTKGFGIFRDALEDHLSRRLHAGATGPNGSAARLATLAELWDKLALGVRDIETYNLDVRPFILSMVSDLAAVAKATKA